MRRNRCSFTAIELVFVIVIIGIVGVAGSQAVYKVIENYLLQREYQRLELSSYRTLSFISRHLERAVWETIHLMGYSEPISWVSEDMENYYGSFDGTSNTPRFSGVINLEKSHASSSAPGDIEITTLGSRLDLPRNDGGSTPKKLFLPSAHDLTSYKGRLQVVKTTAGQNQLTTTPQSPTHHARELYEITHMVEPELFSLVNEDGDVSFRHDGLPPDTSFPFIESYSNRAFKLWFEGERSILRIRLCVFGLHSYLIELLECGDRKGGICETGFCKEIAVVR